VPNPALFILSERFKEVDETTHDLPIGAASPDPNPRLIHV
jgi:hypothetical protein